jgi:transposase
MRKIGEVLRLRAAGFNVRDIARSAGTGKTTVYEYLARAEAAGLRWPLPPELDETALEARLFPPPTAELAAGRPVPDWRAVHRELKRGKHVTLRLLWLEWRQDHADGWGYSQFCDHYQRWLGEQDLVLRLEYAAGERMFVDFSGDRMAVIDAGTGEITPAEIFVSVLGASGMLYVEATRGQDLKSWLLAHVHAYQAYGGVARVTVPDNLKSGVAKACWYDPEINPSYLQLARHFNTVILPTRTARPRDKAAVEAGVLVVERWVLAPLRNRRFFSIGELNQAIRERVAEVNGREFRGQPTSRRDLFLETERPALRPLPPSRYEFTEIKKATASIDYHVEFDHHFYSVPFQLVRQRLEVWATATTIEIYHRHRRVASHLREYGRRRYITDPAHRPASHRAHLEWTPSRLIKWAATVSPAAAQVAERIMLAKPHPEHGYRACLGLMKLTRQYGNERVGAACQRALAINAVSYTSIKSILGQNLDRLPLPGVQLSLVPPPPAHSNLRGPEYYSGEKEA